MNAFGEGWVGTDCRFQKSCSRGGGGGLLDCEDCDFDARGVLLLLLLLMMMIMLVLKVKVVMLVDLSLVWLQQLLKQHHGMGTRGLVVKRLRLHVHLIAAMSERHVERRKDEWS